VVGWVLQNRKARIALDVGSEAVHFQNPYVPDAHSEIALPLMSQGQLIGALSILSVEQAAFSEEDIPLFQALADRVLGPLNGTRS
jgi:GAF domain-containing protein